MEVSDYGGTVLLVFIHLKSVLKTAFGLQRFSDYGGSDYGGYGVFLFLE